MSVTDCLNGAACGTKAMLPQVHSFFSIDNQAVIISALKNVEDGAGFVLRVFNPTAEVQTATVYVSAVLMKAWLCNLDEMREQEMTVDIIADEKKQQAPKAHCILPPRREKLLQFCLSWVR